MKKILAILGMLSVAQMHAETQSFTGYMSSHGSSQWSKQEKKYVYGYYDRATRTFTKDSPLNDGVDLDALAAKGCKEQIKQFPNEYNAWIKNKRDFYKKINRKTDLTDEELWVNSCQFNQRAYVIGNVLANVYAKENLHTIKKIDFGTNPIMAKVKEQMYEKAEDMQEKLFNLLVEVCQHERFLRYPYNNFFEINKLRGVQNFVKVMGLVNSWFTDELLPALNQAGKDFGLTDQSKIVNELKKQITYLSSDFTAGGKQQKVYDYLMCPKDQKCKNAIGRISSSAVELLNGIIDGINYSLSSF